MEGVLVSAKKKGSTITVTVVSDQEGRYRFPRARLAPGTYSIRIRATGYDLVGSPQPTVADSKVATLDLELAKAKNLASQLTNAEWLMSIPGSEPQKKFLLGCVGCHTLERIVRSNYDAEGFTGALRRMSTFSSASTPLSKQKRPARDTDLIGEDKVKFQKSQAEFLASINLGAAKTWKYPLQVLPRPKGKATRAIITEYDLPRAVIQPHDVIVDSDGMAWYSNFGEQNMGKLDTKTGKVKEYVVPTVHKDVPTGALSIRFDRKGDLWLGLMYQGAIAKFDRKTEKFQLWKMPAELNKSGTQVNMTSPMNYDVDGKIWTQNNGASAVHRVDLKTGKWETWKPYEKAPKGHNIYDTVSDSQNNVYFTDLGNFSADGMEDIGRIDAKTGEIAIYKTPTKNSGPRRGSMDAQDRFWFGEFRVNKIGMFDTNTKEFTEWIMNLPWSSPYDAELDKNGDVWTGSMFTDRISRLNPKTGEVIDYMLPRSTNVRRVFVDSSTTPVTFWVGSNHGASIVKLEPLD
ncbi:MAG: carboxypeptidase regulatory-like domain-containing protein [Elusimicrobia bacterium]|nr:carboxypeptidase regulatory-like domain-containing protein [Elusimicrobiota bacterium]